MRAGDELLGAVFNKDHRYVIPIFQRPYVWDEEENWIPLWDDIRKAAESAEAQSEEGDEDAQEYFLGALVTQHRSPIPRRTPTSMVIDGQQRMTTFQVFLAAARRVALDFGALHAADSFAALVRNRVSANSDHPEDRLKVAPLPHDLAGFGWAVREPDDVSPPPNAGHKLVRASRWFEDAIRDWVKESSSANDRLDFLHFAVENRIKVVSIFLDAKDDPQIIFEALNHRGVRLDAADLVKNLLFQLLDRQGDHRLEHELLNDHWSVLDSGHWREEVTTGRIKRVRVDILLAYWLSAQRGEESSVEHLFEDFKRWMRGSEARAADVIRDIRIYAETMDRLQQLPMSSPVAQALDRLDATKTTTPWPLILFLHASPEIPEDQAVIGTLAIDSFLMRRAICRMTTKDYNRLFGTVLGGVRSGDLARAGDLLVAGLVSQTADSRIWPDDSAFINGLMSSNLFNDLVRARLRALLVGLENHLLTTRAEPTLPYRAHSKALTVEHVMPVKWEDNWALSEGVPLSAIERRNNAIHSLGNLTLATQSLNSALSNQGWSKKRHTLQSHSLVRLTTGSILTFPEGVKDFTQDEWVSDWNEDRIDLRGLALIRIALQAWPHPNNSSGLVTSALQPHPPQEPSHGTVSPVSDGTTSSDSPSTTGGAVVSSAGRDRHEVTGSILPLIQAGLIIPGDQLTHQQKRSGATHTATVTAGGRLETDAGTFNAPSSALRALVGYEVNGWAHWMHVSTGKTLGELRELIGR